MQQAGAAHWRFIESRDIWLALDDEQSGNRHVFSQDLRDSEWVSVAELETYHRQLFYWLLIRLGPGIFPAATELSQGVPLRLTASN